MSYPLIGQLVAGAPALGNGNDQPATAKTGKVIRGDLSRYPNLLGKLRGISGPRSQT